MSSSNSSKLPQSKSASRQTQICKLCDKSFANWYNLEVHFNRRHPGEKVIAKGQTVINFEPTQSKKRKASNSSENVSHETQIEGEYPIDSEIPASLTSNKTTDPSCELTTTNTISTHHPVETENSSELVTTNSISNLCTNNDLLTEMQLLLDRLKLESNSDPTIIDPSLNSENNQLSSNPNSDLERKIRLCGSLNELEIVSVDEFKYDRINCAVYCTTCISDDSLLREQTIYHEPGFLTFPISKRIN